jgi:hypothetical protein
MLAMLYETSYEDRRKLARVCWPALRALAGDDEPFVRETALAAIALLAHRLWQVRAYADALPVLDVAVADGPLLGEQLAMRIEARFAAGDRQLAGTCT